MMSNDLLTQLAAYGSHHREVQQPVERESVGVPLVEPTPDLSSSSNGGVRGRSNGPPVWVAAVAATAVLVLGAGAMWLSNTGIDNIYVADGERLISSDPPIVQGAESPEPAFDPSVLGEEVPMTPVSDISRILETANALAHDPADELIRVTVLGETPEGALALVVHAEGESPESGDRMQLRCLTTVGGQSCAGYPIEEAANMADGLIPAEPGTGPGYTVGEKPAESTLTWEVPAETAVVTLAINGQSRWQRPVADVAVFVTDLVYGDRFELTAFDAQGNTLDSVSVVTRP